MAKDTETPNSEDFETLTEIDKILETVSRKMQVRIIATIIRWRSYESELADYLRGD